MNPDWQDFLARHGASWADGVVQRFGDTAAELDATSQHNIICDLSQFGTLRVSGEDAQSFLQNLLSNDIRAASATRAQYSSLNTAKGRLLATLLIWREGDDYLLQLPRELCTAIAKKLSMYVLRAKVKVSDTGDDVVTLGVSGANAQGMLAEQFDAVPQLILDVLSHNNGSVIKVGDARFIISTAATNAEGIWTSLSQHARPVGSTCWDWLNIRSGIPVILPATQEQFVAQMVNLELIGGVNFSKGCYPGQEIVARMQYLGKLKRRMYLAHLDSNDPPLAGDELFSAEMAGQASGMIVNAAPAPGGGYDVLASVQTSSRESQQLHWKSLQGGTLQFLPPPYAMPDA